MSDAPYRLRFWGVRGSIPTPSAEMIGYGGHTTCLCLPLSDREYLILDGGTGIRPLGESIRSAVPRRPLRFHIFFTHYHLDHVLGLAFFDPLYDPACEITFYGIERPGHPLARTLQSLIAPPFFPAPLANAPAQVRYVSLDGAPVRIGPVTVESLPLHHPDGSVAFRLSRENRRIVLATDHEHGNPATDAALVAFAGGADSLIYDAMYEPAEYEEMHRGWGHSTWPAGVQAARAAGVGRLVLFHHHPGRTDAQLDALAEIVRRELPGSVVAREGMLLDL